MEIKKYQYTYRRCPVCENDNFNKRGTICDEVTGIKYIHKMRVDVGVCDCCGFMYANPTIQQSMLDEYYADRLSVFEQESSFNIDKRIDFIKEYIDENTNIVEIGGNGRGKFREELLKYVKSYSSMDVNDQDQHEYSEWDFLPQTDIVISYYVLEHIVDLDTMLNRVSNCLKKGGKFVVEVPDASIYAKNPHCLRCVEHVNHFSYETLCALMSNFGFAPIKFSKRYASREYGIVVCFEMVEEYRGKKGKDYLANLSYIDEGIKMIDDVKKQILICANVLSKMELKKCVFWCASDIMFSLLNEMKLEEEKKPIIIDEDPRKQGYYRGEKIISFRESLQIGCWDNITQLIICSECRVNSVLTSIKNSGLKLEIMSIDDMYEIHTVV